MAGGEPVAQVRRQQEGLVAVAAQEVVGHSRSYLLAVLIPNAFILTGVLQNAGWGTRRPRLPGGRCPLVVVLLDVQAGRHSNRPCCPSHPWRGTALYGIGPRARYLLGLKIYSNEPIPASGGPA